MNCVPANPPRHSTAGRAPSISANRLARPWSVAYSLTIHKLRIVLAKVLVHHLRRLRPLVIQAWLWLAAEADGLEEKRRCLDAVLQPDPKNEPATLALLVLDQKRPTN
ncbi:MAG TPA: hypothetical protein VM537_21285 [Anaerolineae bacterium]|nr:hypothetical protein [Anaerolineae bacterium]